MASHAVLKEQLIEMGFNDKLIQGALKLLKEKATLESVIESIENGSAEKSAEQPDLVNDDQSAAISNVEATPEELEAKKKALEEKIKQRRIQLEEKEKEDERLREIQRRKDGKGIGKMKEEIEQIKRERYVESLKKEKAEEKAARDSILHKIEQDKAERRAKLSGSVQVPTPAASTKSAVPEPVAVNKEGKAKLGIRLLDGTQLVQDFDSKEILSSVRAYIVTQKNIDYNITLAMPPRLPFSEDDMEKPLHALGLVPTARLHVVKRN